MAAAQQSEPGSAEMAEAPVVDRSGFAWSRPDAGTPETEPAYRTFPKKIAPSLLAAGATFALIGGLGAWIRAVELRTVAGTLGPQQAGQIWGYSEPTGRAIAILAAVALVIAAATTSMNVLPRFALEAAALVLVGVLIARLISLNSRVSSITAAARGDLNANLTSFNAGFTWGAWLMLLALVFVFLGLVVGALRELDRIRGLPE